MHLPALATSVLVLGLVPLSPTGGAAPSATTLSFPDARLKIEYNATDGDAGLQVFLDAPAWREISITNPSGRQVLEVEAEQVIRNYGLTELFSESSEPPFDEFPFERFKALFPEGTYTFRGRTVEGERLRSSFVLTHAVPDAPAIETPAEGATVRPDALMVSWRPVTTPPGIDVVAYQVLVVAEEPPAGLPKPVLDVTVGASVDRLPIPAPFLAAGAYKAEVLAIERGGNQTLTEVAFTVS